MWPTFLIDLLKVAPNRLRASHGPYVMIPQAQLEETTIETYQNLNLAEISDDVQWTVATKEQWNVPQASSHLHQSL